MKKTLILGLLGLATSAATSFGQGVILLDNYNTSGPNVTYGAANIPANGVSGGFGSQGSGLLAGWTMGVYTAFGSVVVGADPSGTALPETLGGGLALGSGTGSTAAFFTSSGTAGRALAGGAFAVPGTLAAGGQTVTVMVIAYSGADYAGAAYRGHSVAFTMSTSANNASSPNPVGAGMATFGVFSTAPIPEPTTFALAGLGAAALMAFRRKK